MTSMLLEDVSGARIAIVQVANTNIVVSFRGIFVNKQLMSRLAMCKLGFCRQVPSAKWNETMTVYSLAIKGALTTAVKTERTEKNNTKTTTTTTTTTKTKQKQKQKKQNNNKNLQEEVYFSSSKN